MSNLCLTILCQPEVEERLLDLLLLWPQVSIYTRNSVSTHGVAFGTLSQMEQVIGLALATQIQVICTPENKGPLLEQMREQFSGTGLRYWITAIAEAGELE